MQELLNRNSGLLEKYLTDPEPKYPINLNHFYHRSPIRFDFDIMPSDKKDMHPDVHLHISMENCRIPVEGPLCIREFMKFIVENFYPDIPVDGSLVNGLPSWNCNDMLTNFHKSKLHFNILN